MTNPEPVLDYAHTTPPQPAMPFSVGALIAGIVLPSGYAVAALYVVGLVTSQRSAMEAFYSLDFEVLAAAAVFPALVWAIHRRRRSRGFLLGVAIGLAALPLLGAVAFMIDFVYGT